MFGLVPSAGSVIPLGVLEQQACLKVGCHPSPGLKNMTGSNVHYITSQSMACRLYQKEFSWEWCLTELWRIPTDTFLTDCRVLQQHWGHVPLDSNHINQLFFKVVCLILNFFLLVHIWDYMLVCSSSVLLAISNIWVDIEVLPTLSRAHSTLPVHPELHSSALGEMLRQMHTVHLGLEWHLHQG